MADNESKKSRSAAQAWSESTGRTSKSSTHHKRSRSSDRSYTGNNSSKKKKKYRRGSADVRRYISILVVVLVLLVVCFIGFMPIDEKITQGLDIQGGVSVVMTASKPDGSSVSDSDMESAVSVITNRVNALGASEATVQRQGNDQILIQLPGATDAQQVIDIIGTTGTLEFVDLNDISDQDALQRIYNGATDVELAPGTYTAFMTGDELNSVSIGQESSTSAYYAVNLKLNSAGAAAFAEVTTILAPTHGRIAIVLDGVVQSAPAVQSAITDGEVAITGGYTLSEAQVSRPYLNPVRFRYRLNIQNRASSAPHWDRIH